MLNLEPPAVGSPVHARMRKWDGTPHWQSEAVYLGADEFGHWIGNPIGTWVSRPGVGWHSPSANVKLLPHDGWFVANFNGPEAKLSIYTDVSTPPELTDGADGWTMAAVDLDLDVIRSADGRIWLEDEDEFAEHQLHYPYPADVIEAAGRSAAELLAAVRAGEEPWAGVGHGWLARVG